MSEILITQYHVEGTDPEWHIKVMEALGVKDLAFKQNMHVEGAKLPCAFQLSDPYAWFGNTSISIYDTEDEAWSAYNGNNGDSPRYIIDEALMKVLRQLSVDNPEAEFYVYDLESWMVYIDRWSQGGKHASTAIELLYWFDRKELWSMMEDEPEYFCTNPDCKTQYHENELLLITNNLGDIVLKCPKCKGKVEKY